MIGLNFTAPQGVGGSETVDRRQSGTGVDSQIFSHLNLGGGVTGWAGSEAQYRLEL